MRTQQPAASSQQSADQKRERCQRRLNVQAVSSSPFTLHPSPHSLLAFTLVEIVIGAAVLAIAIVALLGAFLGQITLNEHARNLTLAMNDANRIMEQMRQQNTGAGCSTPAVQAPGGATWNAWLATTNAGGGKSISGESLPLTPAAAGREELIVVTCQNQAGTAYCANTQFGAGEWHGPGPTVVNPMRVTVAVCWRHRSRSLGECVWNNALGVLVPTDGTVPYNVSPPGTAGVIDSPAMLSTLMTCRS